MVDVTGDTAALPGGDLVSVAAGMPAHAGGLPLSAAGQAALDAARALGRKAAAPATLRAYKADWTHYAAWCAAHGFVPVPPEPVTVGAYLASLAETHAPATVRRRLSAIGKMHRFNDLPWNLGHRDIAGPLGGLLRQHGRPARKAAALTLAMLRQLVATCDGSNRGRRAAPCSWHRGSRVTTRGRSSESTGYACWHEPWQNPTQHLEPVSGSCLHAPALCLLKRRSNT